MERRSANLQTCYCFIYFPWFSNSRSLMAQPRAQGKSRSPTSTLTSHHRSWEKLAPKGKIRRQNGTCRLRATAVELLLGWGADSRGARQPDLHATSTGVRSWVDGRIHVTALCHRFRCKLEDLIPPIPFVSWERCPVTVYKLILFFHHALEMAKQVCNHTFFFP